MMNSSHNAPVSCSSSQFFLLDLILWMLGVSFSMGLERYTQIARIDSTDGIRTVYQQYEFVTRLVIAPVGGAGIAALLRTCIRRPGVMASFPSEPGHWLMVNFGLLYVLQAAPRILLALHITSLADSSWIVAGIGLIMTLVQAEILSQVQYRKYWHVLLGVEVLRRAANALFNAVHALVASRIWANTPLGLFLAAEFLLPITVLGSACALVYAVRSRA